jgi:Protein of unknown function (DUF2975)
MNGRGWAAAMFKTSVSRANEAEIERIKAIGRHLERLVLALMMAGPVLFLALLATGQWLDLLEIPRDAHVDLSGLLSGGHLALGAVAALKPAAVLTVFWFLHRLFRLYRQGIVLERADVDCIGRIGWALVAVDVVAVLERALVGPVLSAFGAVSPGYFVLGISVSYSVIGLFVVAIARVMSIARRLKEFEKLTV